MNSIGQAREENQATERAQGEKGARSLCQVRGGKGCGCGSRRDLVSR